jgi:hypothetical protein
MVLKHPTSLAIKEMQINYIEIPSHLRMAIKKTTNADYKGTGLGGGTLSLVGM